MKLNDHIFNVANSGQAIGVNKACGRVTIDPDWQLHSTDPIYAGSPRGPFRYYQSDPSGATPTPVTIEIELPNIKTINVDRSMSQDIGTCKIAMYNQWHDGNAGMIPESLTQLGKPGYFWPERGGDQYSQELWNQQPSVGALQKDGTVDEGFEWTNAIVPNALIRTYQGYGGHDLSIDEAISQGKIMLTGVWLIDSISAGTEGMLNIDCRDIGRLLLEQTVYPPLIPDYLYPLEYFPAGTSGFDSPWGARPSMVDDLNTTQAAYSEERCFYKEASSDVSVAGGVLGGNVPIGTATEKHLPSHAADGNLKDYAWSKASLNATGSDNQAYWEFWVGNTLRDAQTMTYKPEIQQQNEYWGMDVEPNGNFGLESAYNNIVLGPGTDRRVLPSGSSYKVNGATLTMQTDGNLVLTHGKAEGSALTSPGTTPWQNPTGRRTAWQTNTAGNPGAYAIMQTDGNFVVYSTSGRALWDSKTYGHPDAILVLQWDHNLVIYSPLPPSDDRWGANKPPSKITLGGSGVSGVVNSTAIWNSWTHISIAATGEKPKAVESVSFTPWAGGSMAYVSVWDLETGAWAKSTLESPIPGSYNIDYVGKISIPTCSPESNMENEVTITLPRAIHTNRIRITLLATSDSVTGSPSSWHFSGAPDPITGGQYRCGLRSVYCRVSGARASAYAGDPTALMWTYAFDAHPTRGYWVTDSNGVVYGFGDAADYDSTTFGSPDIATAGPWVQSSLLFKQNTQAPTNYYKEIWANAWPVDSVWRKWYSIFFPPQMPGYQDMWGNPNINPWPDPDAYWITDYDGADADSYADSERWFRRTITINTGVGGSAVLHWTADNESDFFFNRVGEPLRVQDSQKTNDWRVGFSKTLKDPVTGSTTLSGVYELTWRVKNYAALDPSTFGSKNPASLIWCLLKNDQKYAVSNSATLVSAYGNFLVDMVSTPSGEGYWLLDRYGRIYNYGDAAHYGDMVIDRLDQVIDVNKQKWNYSGDNGISFGLSGRQAISIARTPTGNGYWVMYTHGNVYGFGDARYAQTAEDLAIGQVQTYKGYYDATRKYTPGNVVSYKLGTATKYWSKKDYPVGVPDAGNAPAAGSYWTDITDYFFPSAYSAGISYPPLSVVYYNSGSAKGYWRRKDYDLGSGRVPAEGDRWESLTLLPGTHITLQSESHLPVSSSGWPTKLPARVGPMTGPMISQPIPYTFKMPNRGTELGYKLTNFPSSSYATARRGTALCAHPTQLGFWVTDGSGQVWPIGDCEFFGEIDKRTYDKGSTSSFSMELFDWVTSMESTKTGNGYWLAVGSGKIAAFGDARNQGPIDIYEKNPQLNAWGGLNDVAYTDDYGNDWTRERNSIWGLRRDADGKGFWILQANGGVHGYDAQDWGKPGHYGFSGYRWHDGNIDDYSDIVKDLAAWCGFTAYSESEPDTNTEFKKRPPVWGNIERTGIFSDSRLPGDRWDRRTALDCINQVKQIVGYNFFIDDSGGIRFESPNWWQAGNFDENGGQIAVIYDENNNWERVLKPAINEVQTIRERTNVTAGTFTITYDGQTTTPIAHNATATTVQAALIALSNLNVGDVVVTGGIVTTTPLTLTFGGSLAGTNIAAVTVDIKSLTGTLTVASESWQEFLDREGAENFIPEVHEGVNMMGYSATLDGSSYVSEIIIGADQPDFRTPNAQNSFVRFIPENSVSSIRLDSNGQEVPALRNINRVAAWVDNYFINPEEQRTMAELINLQIWFNQRIGSISMVGNPNIGMNDQIRVVERNTSETYIHYVRGVSSSMDLDTGSYVMNLSTNRLGDDSNWVITTGEDATPSYNPMTQIQISETVSRWQEGLGRGVPPSSNGSTEPTFTGSFIRR